ncbi:Uncharacterised protein [Candidatus Bilamarchaeum dharawalense]|uniref:Lipoprotein n=1 Tax=Candidatus Bilamarchaeum dharawalense TaxID=2885759 RepID=A0A5E4LTS2_9ARCH|nr:Uncharacterised protein [Candidatus Bilamarchaeum dharawalense]
MNRLLLFGIILVGIFLIAGCTTTASKECKCPNSTVSSSLSCPPKNNQTQIKEVTIEKTKYVCWDNSTVDVALQCSPQPEKITEKTVTVTVNLTRYVCSNGQTVNDATLCPTPEAVSQAKTFSGDSADVTDQIYLKKGLVLITGYYSGKHNFIVQLLDSDGANVDLIFNEIGNYDGKHATHITTDGYYRFGVEGIVGWNDNGGSWTLKVEQQS